MKKKFICLLLICASVGIRLGCFDYQTLDYINFLKPWVEFYRSYGGFSALKYSIGNYNIPYLYFLALFSYFPVNELYLIKGLSCLFDFLLAYSAYKLSGKKYVFYVVLFLPTVVINSALWAQCDSIYVSLGLMSIYHAFNCNGKKSMVYAALSFGFKLQAVFILPCLVIIWIYKKLNIKDFIFFPITYFLIIIPAVILGYPFSKAFTLYYDQIGTVGSAMNYNSPSLTAIVDNLNPDMLIVCAFVAMFILLLMPKKSKNGVLILCALMVTVIPFLLPHMHDRYFYASDIFAVIIFSLFPVCSILPVFTQAASLICYLAYLTTHYFRVGNVYITNGTGAYLELITILILLCLFVRSQLKSTVPDVN